MNLILDIGNTKIKLAIFSNYEVIFQESLEEIDFSYLEKLVTDFPELKHSIISSTRLRPEKINKLLDTKLEKCFILDHNTPIPIKNNYKSPKSLGYDRIANVTAANHEFPGNNVLVIDVGTAITYDFITSNDEFMGGNISPGAEMRANSLNKFTENLPLVNLNSNPSLLGNTTEDALISGVVNGIIFEIDAYIEKINELHNNLQVILTGGDVKLFDKKLKKHIFVDSNLNLKGLNRILHYNVS